jgi:hypothetical protein
VESIREIERRMSNSAKVDDDGILSTHGLVKMLMLIGSSEKCICCPRVDI